MKKYLSLITILIINSYVLTYSQNAIDPPVLPSGINDTVFSFDNTNIIHRMDDKFILGWNYGGPGRALDSLMKSNYYLDHWETGMTITWANHGDNHNWYIRLWPLTTGTDASIVETQALYYEPSINVDKSDGFVPTPEHTGGAVFGFQNKDQNLTISDNKVVIDGDESTTVPILSNIWPKNELKFWNKFGDKNYDDISRGDDRDLFNGKRLYLSINLKGSQAAQTTHLDSTLLRLKVKYYAQKIGSDSTHTGYLKFKTRPGVLLQNITSSLGHYRGKTRNDDSLLTPTREFLITPRMLITDVNGNPSEFITLSSLIQLFYNDSLVYPFDNNNFFNPYLYPKVYDRQSNILEDEVDRWKVFWIIDSLDIEVYYSSAAGVGAEIDWVKLEVPKARDLFRGVHDKYIRFKFFQIYSLFQSNNSGHKIAGIYANDEYYPNLWAASRYLTKLLDGLSNSENDKYETYPSQFLHATDYNMFFNGKNVWYGIYKSVPYYDLGSHIIPHAETFGILHGRRGRDDSQFSHSELFNSRYETWLPGMGGVDMSFPFANYEPFEKDTEQDGFIYSFGLLYDTEKRLYRSYFTRKSMLFGNAKWIAWMFLISQNWGTSDSFPSFYVKQDRPCTGEEFKYASFIPIALGAKGLFYWLKNKFDNLELNTDPYDIGIIGTPSALLPTKNPTTLNTFPKDISLLVDERLTGDFINVNVLDNFYKWKDHYQSQLYNWNLLGIPVNQRIYIGLTTFRTEMYKLHSWIANNSATLESIELAAWFGKGFSTFYQQRDGYASDIIKKYIDIDSIKTRPLGRIENGQPLFEQGIIDSGFYDITILKHNNFDLNKVFYLSVVNRRTDPLIYFTEVPNDKHMLFLSSNEFDVLCDNGGVNPMRPNGANYPDTLWQKYYWRRLGCREITLPFNYKFSNNPNDVAILKVTELRTENDSVGYWEWPWWRKERFDNYYSAVVKSNESIALRFLPGEGKMLKVEIVGTVPVQGELANSNQTKLIAYPKNQAGNQDFSGKDDTVYYHLVYHRKDPVTEKYNVYYRRSLHPYTHDLASKGIQWGMEYQLAHNLVLHRNLHLPNLFVDSTIVAVGSECECKYPSLVARWDEVNNRANVHVLFSCTQPPYTDTPRVFIVEKVFDINSNPSPELLSPIAYGYADGNDGTELDRWGLSSINGAFRGNYYAWNDYYFGITAGFKEPHDRGFVTNRLNLKYNTTEWKAGGPSLNTYSGIQIYENVAAVAWHEEVSTPQTRGNIYYSMLDIDQNGNIYNFVPSNFCTGEIYFHDALSSNGIAWLHPHPSVAFANFRNPILYRTIEGKLDTNLNIEVGSVGFRVYWEGKYHLLAQRNDIFMKMIDLGAAYQCWNCLYPLRIYDENLSLGQPNLSQGSFFRGEQNYPFNFSDSAIVVNFISYSSSLTKPDYNSKIYQIDHDFWGIFVKNGAWPPVPPLDTNFVEIEPTLLELGEGIYPHLSRLPVLNQEADWLINQRVYQSTNEQIQTTYNYFLRKGELEKKKLYPLLKAFDTESDDEVTISQIHLINYSSEQHLKIPRLYAQERHERGFRFLDTAVTSWFRLPDFSQLSFFVSDYKSDLIDIIIERFTDNKEFEVPVTSLRGKTKTFNKINLLNGGKELYRIKYIRKNKNIWFMPEVMLASEIDFVTQFDRLSDKELEKYGATEEQTVDIGISDKEISLIAYPNPSGERVNIIIKNNSVKEVPNNPARIIITNLLGEEIFSQDWVADKQLTIDFSDKAVGVYFINAVIQNNISACLVLRKQITIIR